MRFFVTIQPVSLTQVTRRKFGQRPKRSVIVNLLTQLALVAASCYLRRSPVPKGRWRLIKRFLPELRANGKDLGKRVVRTRYGFKFKADLGDWLGQYVYLTGIYEYPTARVIAKLLKLGDTFIDVGANQGYFTFLASDRVGTTGRVLSFKPVPSMHKRLMENIAVNSMSNVSMHDVAPSNAEGVLPLFEGPEGHKGISSLRPIDSSAATIEVKTLPLPACFRARRDTVGKLTNPNGISHV